MENKYVLQLKDIQQIAENAGHKISKKEASQLLNDNFSGLCDENEAFFARVLNDKE